MEGLPSELTDTVALHLVLHIDARTMGHGGGDFLSRNFLYFLYEIRYGISVVVCDIVCPVPFSRMSSTAGGIFTT